MQPGIYPSIPEDDYHASVGVSVSRLKRFAKVPAYAQVHQAETDAMRFGTVIHFATLQPHLLERRYAPTRLDRTGTKAWAAEEAANPGRELVKQHDWDAARRIRDAVQAHPIGRDLFNDRLQVEQSIYWNDPATGLLCRGRTDGIQPDMRVLVDLKSALDASPDGFARAAADRRYHWQDPYYCRGIAAACGWQPEAFIFVAVEKFEPYLVAAYEIAPDARAAGDAQVQATLRRYAECVETGVWPGYSDTLETLHLPAWALREED